MPADPKDVLDRLEESCEEIWYAHARPDHPSYNECDTAECQWCAHTKADIATLRDALAARGEREPTPSPDERGGEFLGLTTVPATVEEMLYDLVVSLGYAHENAEGLTKEGARQEHERALAIVEALRAERQEPVGERVEGWTKRDNPELWQFTSRQWGWGREHRATLIIWSDDDGR